MFIIYRRNFGLAVCLIVLCQVMVSASGDESPPGSYYIDEPSACSSTGDITFVSDESGDADLWILNRKTGEKRTLLSWPDSVERAPDWNLRCDRIAFFSTRGTDDQVWQIWTVKPDGTDPRQITFEPGMNKFPRWAPDGKTILFSADRGGSESGLYIVPSEGGAGRQIYSGRSPPPVHPSWSPDGKGVAFIQCSGFCQVFSISLDQMVLTAQTFDGVDKLGTDWGREGILTTSMLDGNQVGLCVDPNGSAPRQATFPSAGYSDSDVRWDPYEGGVVMIRSGEKDEVWVRTASGVEHRIGQW